MFNAFKTMQSAMKARPAVVFDIDETAMFSPTAPPFRGPQDQKIFNAWARREESIVNPRVHAMYERFLKKGYEVHFVTARSPEVMEATASNLRKAGYHTFSGLHMKPEGMESAAFKMGIRKKLYDMGRVVRANIGDADSDFVGGFYQHKVQIKSNEAEFVNPEVEFGLTGGWSGTGNLSHEELARKELFYHVKEGGSFTHLGKQPDVGALTQRGAVVAVHQHTGEQRVVNNWMARYGDREVLERFGSSLPKPNAVRMVTEMIKDSSATTRAVMKAGTGEAVAGGSVVSAIVRGAKKMKPLL